MYERSVSAGCRFFLPAVLLILGGLAVGTSRSQPAKPDQKEEVKEKKVKFSMDGRPWRAVFEWLTDVTGKPVICDSPPTGTFSFIAPKNKEYTIAQVIDIINDALVTHSEKDKYYLSTGERSFALMPTDENNKRFKQISLQLSLQLGGEAVVFTRPDVAKELKLSAAQQTKLKAIERERRKALLPLFLTGESHEEIEKRVTGDTKTTFAQLLAVLNDSQQTQLKDLLGEPYWFMQPKSEVYYSVPLPGDLDGPDPEGGRLFVVAPSVAIIGVLCADNKVLQAELNLNADQVKRLIGLCDRTMERIEHGSPFTVEWQDKMAQQAKDNEKALAQILEPKQRERFKQITLRYFLLNYIADDNTPGMGPSLLAQCVEVADELQLSKDQKDQLEQGTMPGKVLDEKQQLKLKAMLGEPFKKVDLLKPRPVGGPPRRGLPNKRLQNLMEKAVQEDLKLTEEQVKKLLELARDWEERSEALQPYLLRGPKEEIDKKKKEAQDSLEKSIDSILDVKQTTRLHQIELQLRKKQLWVYQNFYLNEAVQLLELNQDQTKALRQLLRGYAKTRNLMRCELYRIVDRKLDEDYRKTMDEFNRITEKNLNGVLTAKQQDQLKALLGEPFMGELRCGPSVR